MAKGGRVAVVGEAAVGGVVEEREAEGAGTRVFVTWLRTHGVTAVSS